MPYFTPTPTAANVLAKAAQVGGQGNLAASMRILNQHGLSVDDLRNYLISTNGIHGLGAADPDVAAQLQSIRFDWKTGNMYVGTNKYSILTTVLGGIVVKGLLWGTNKVGAGARALVGRKKAATNPRRRR